MKQRCLSRTETSSKLSVQSVLSGYLSYIVHSEEELAERYESEIDQFLGREEWTLQARLTNLALYCRRQTTSISKLLLLLQRDRTCFSMCRRYEVQGTNI